MAHTIEQFAQQCSTILRADPGPAGRQKVCDLLKEVLKDKEFVKKTIPESTSDRHLLYEDPDLKFCIFAHYHHGPKTSQPHDHGPSWAIYGQAEGVTEMTDWELLEPASADKPGKVRKKKSYSMTPGSAYIYSEGILHSPARTDATKLIRLEGMNMDTVKRLKFEAAA
jgi:predicted metal-dependent enzyme (double-stranded beta helix superfamily)